MRDLGLSRVSTCLAGGGGGGGPGGPVPGKIGLESQSVAGPAPHHHTHSSQQSLVLQKTEREPTFTVRATADQHVEW